MGMETKKLKLTIGAETFSVGSLEEASAVYQSERDRSGEGASTYPSGRVGKHRISYNGRVWLGDKLVLEAQ